MFGPQGVVLCGEVLETLGGGIQLVEVGGPWRILSLAPSSYFSLLPVFNEVHRSSTTYSSFHDGQAPNENRKKYSLESYAVPRILYMMLHSFASDELCDFRDHVKCYCSRFT